ncbi:two-component histidine kinase [Rhodococcus coprophilus]|uniref:Two-component histidine kinase n=1 Tax=Rhodococcus coprophilus TaxID=38310 RepID=A0A2X4U8T7_9NOCA|nr:two-component histidine kinase [Rhodococcus coprophilus]
MPVDVPDRSSGGGTAAADRLLRMFAWFIAIGYMCYLLLVAPAIVGQAGLTASWWTPTAAVMIFGSCIALGLSASFCDKQEMKRVAAVNALLYLGAVALWFPAWNGSVAPQDESLWFSFFPGVASFAAAVAWRPPWAFLHMVCAVLLAQVADHTVRDAPFTQSFVPDVAFGIVFCTLFLAAAVVGLGTGRMLDETVAATHEAAATSAALEARNVERERFDALVHDRVMSTFLAVARRAPDDSVVPQAARALAELDDLRRREDDEPLMDAGMVVSRLRAAATEADEEIAFCPSVSREAETAGFPAEPVRVAAAALAEAVRNSVRHAGPDAARSVTAEVRQGRLDVHVVDDGCGFEPRDVAEDRLGVSVSICARMKQLAGGTAEVRSVPGAGTAVHLSWREQRS